MLLTLWVRGTNFTPSCILFGSIASITKVVHFKFWDIWFLTGDYFIKLFPPWNYLFIYFLSTSHLNSSLFYYWNETAGKGGLEGPWNCHSHNICPTSYLLVVYQGSCWAFLTMNVILQINTRKIIVHFLVANGILQSGDCQKGSKHFKASNR